MKEWLENKLRILNDILFSVDDILSTENNQHDIYYYEGQRDVVLDLLEFIKNN